MNNAAMELDNIRQDLIKIEQQYTQQISLWDQLTLAQEFSVCSLGQFGYTLSDLYDSPMGKMAVLTLGKKTATISENGYINTNPH